MGYWNAEWQNLRDRGCICEMLNYDPDQRRNNPSCPYHNPPMETGDDMGARNIEAACAMFPQSSKHTPVEVPDDAGDHIMAEYKGGTSRSGNITANIGHAARFGCGVVHPGSVESCTMGCNPMKEPEPLKSNEIRVEAIYDAVAGDIIRIEIENPPTQEAREILIDILPNVLDAWLHKNKDYGDSDELKALGPRAEVVRLWNKMVKLKAGLWEGRELSGEQVPEIMGDMIAHLLLGLKRLRD